MYLWLRVLVSFCCFLCFSFIFGAFYCFSDFLIIFVVFLLLSVALFVVAVDFACMLYFVIDVITVFAFCCPCVLLHFCMYLSACLCLP